MEAHPSPRVMVYTGASWQRIATPTGRRVFNPSRACFYSQAVRDSIQGFRCWQKPRLPEALSDPGRTARSAWACQRNWRFNCSG